MFKCMVGGQPIFSGAKVIFQNHTWTKTVMSHLTTIRNDKKKTFTHGAVTQTSQKKKKIQAEFDALE